MRACNELFARLSSQLQAEEGDRRDSPAGRLTEQLGEMLTQLEEHDKLLAGRLLEAVPNDMGAVQTLVTQHKVRDAKNSDLGPVSLRFRSSFLQYIRNYFS